MVLTHNKEGPTGGPFLSRVPGDDDPTDSAQVRSEFEFLRYLLFRWSSSKYHIVSLHFKTSFFLKILILPATTFSQSSQLSPLVSAVEGFRRHSRAQSPPQPEACLGVVRGCPVDGEPMRYRFCSELWANGDHITDGCWGLVVSNMFDNFWMAFILITSHFFGIYTTSQLTSNLGMAWNRQIQRGLRMYHTPTSPVDAFLEAGLFHWFWEWCCALENHSSAMLLCLSGPRLKIDQLGPVGLPKFETYRLTHVDSRLWTCIL